MKRYVVVGLGNFGSAVAEGLYAQGHDVVAIDNREEAVDRIAPRVSQAAVADGRQRDLLERFGARDCDAAIVSMGDDITASVLTLMALRDLGVPRVYVKVNSLEHGRVMARLGATETVFPEREAAENLTTRLSAETVLNYVHLGGGFSLQEMVVPTGWEGRSLRELQLPLRYRLSVVGVHDVLTDEIHVPPDPDEPLRSSDTLVLAGKVAALRRAAKME